MAVVFVLCGLWHGANWTFVLWGMYHGVFLILERVTGIRDVPPEKYMAVRRATTLFIVILGWVLFRSTDISQAAGFLRAMFIVSDLPLSYELSLALNYRNVLFMVAALMVFFLPREFSGIKILISNKDPISLLVYALMVLLLLPYCAALIIGGSTNPFIYYRF